MTYVQDEIVRLAGQIKTNAGSEDYDPENVAEMADEIRLLVWEGLDFAPWTADRGGGNGTQARKQA